MTDDPTPLIQPPRQAKPVLSPAMLADLAANNPLGREDVTPEVVQAWFDVIWLTYREKAYKDHRRAIASWWSRVRDEEIDRAMALVKKRSQPDGKSRRQLWEEEEQRRRDEHEAQVHQERGQ